MNAYCFRKWFLNALDIGTMGWNNDIYLFTCLNLKFCKGIYTEITSIIYYII